MASTASRPRDPLLLGSSLLGGLVVGAALNLHPPALVGATALGVQTLLTVGALGDRATSSLRVVWRRAAGLFVLHHLAMTVPLAITGALLGLDTALGTGVFLLAAVPPAAVTPAYAEVVGGDVAAVVGFCVLGYAVGLLATPLLILMALGEQVAVEATLLVLCVGLIGPTVIGFMGRSRLGSIRVGTRRRLVSACLFVVTLSLGGGFPDAFAGGELGITALAVAAVVVVGRTFGTAAVARVVAPYHSRVDAPFAGGFKNVALAATVGGVLAGPVAAIPALLSFPGEVALFLHLARRQRRSDLTLTVKQRTMDGSGQGPASTTNHPDAAGDGR